MKITRPATCLALSMPLVSIALPHAAHAQPARDVSRQAAALLAAAYPADGPGAAAVVVQGGRTILIGGRGLADLQARRPITPDTVFRLASMTKQFTAAVILQLVAEKRLTLDDPLARFLPDWPQPGARATVRQLLNHNSGIADFTKIPGWMGSAAALRPNSTADLLALTRSRPAVAEPGRRWEYNNGGYMILGAIIEQLTGKPWHVAVVERIGRPLGLRSLAYAADPRAAAARGYTAEGTGYVPAAGAHISVAHAAGGLVASVRDLAKWSEALHHGRVVSPALYQEMIRPAAMADGSHEPYGFGLRLGRVRGQAALVHGGAGRGIDTDSIYVPPADLFVAVLANSDRAMTDPATLTRRLAALALGAPVPAFAPAPVDPVTLTPLFGSYGSGDATRRFFSRDGKFYLGRRDDELEVVAAGEDRFFVKSDSLNWFRIRRANSGGAPMMEVYRIEDAGPEAFVRSGDVPVPFAAAPALLRSYVGTYRTEGPVLHVALRDDGRLTIAPPGEEPLLLRAVSDTEFRFEGGPMRLVFQPENGATGRLTLYRGARELHGVRIAP